MKVPLRVSCSLIGFVGFVGLLTVEFSLAINTSFREASRGSFLEPVSGCRNPASETPPPCRRGLGFNIGTAIITYTLWGLPYYSYSIMGPKTPF